MKPRYEVSLEVTKVYGSTVPHGGARNALEDAALEEVRKHGLASPGGKPTRKQMKKMAKDAKANFLQSKWLNQTSEGKKWKAGFNAVTWVLFLWNAGKILYHVLKFVYG